MKFSVMIVVWVVVSGISHADPAIEPNVGHLRHHHHYGDKLETEPANSPRFVTSRQGAADLLLPKEKDMFSFVVFGDRTGGPVDGVAVLADAVRDVNLLEPDMVMTVGDLVQGYNQESAWVAQAKEFKGIMNELRCPWFPVAGNHDVYWRGPDLSLKPPGGNEKSYEMHFGPLWYAFEHKKCWFIVLYSDEANPATGEQNFSKPECQKMSDEQFSWLADTLVKAKGAEHVFLFLHHPRWLKGGYGNDWDRVHEKLKEAGNVSAVFAGHIHQMRYDGPKDGIEYVTLATTGGHQPGLVPDAGYLHHFDIVTVRKDRIALAAVPVGEVLDVREITGDVVTDTNRLVAQPLRPLPEIDLAALTTAGNEVAMTLSNPSGRPVEFTVIGDSGDKRWDFQPDHTHGALAPGESRELKFLVSRPADSLDEWFDDPVLEVAMDYLAEGFRYSIPARRVALPLKLPPGSLDSTANLAIDLDGLDEWLSVPSERVNPGEVLTLECRFKARSFGERTGLVTKTENSDYGIFVNAGRPVFSIFVGDSYLTVSADSTLLQPDVWHHVAGVYDGTEARLYVDGKLRDRKARSGKRKTNGLPLVIGGDTSGKGAESLFPGLIDEVRLSRSARYAGESAAPRVHVPADEDTVLLLDFNERIGPWFPDASENRAHATLQGAGKLIPAGD